MAGTVTFGVKVRTWRTMVFVTIVEVKSMTIWRFVA